MAAVEKSVEVVAHSIGKGCCARGARGSLRTDVASEKHLEARCDAVHRPVGDDGRQPLPELATGAVGRCWPADKHVGARSPALERDVVCGVALGHQVGEDGDLVRARSSCVYTEVEEARVVRNDLPALDSRDGPSVNHADIDLIRTGGRARRRCEIGNWYVWFARWEQLKENGSREKMRNGHVQHNQAFRAVPTSLLALVSLPMRLAYTLQSFVVSARSMVTLEKLRANCMVCDDPIGKTIVVVATATLLYRNSICDGRGSKRA